MDDSEVGGSGSGGGLPLEVPVPVTRMWIEGANSPMESDRIFHFGLLCCDLTGAILVILMNIPLTIATS